MKTLIVTSFFIIGLFNVCLCYGQPKTENVVLITIDGLRWEELFRGANADILKKKRFISGTEAKKNFWHDEVKERRRLLFPFLWSTFSGQGQIYGNRDLGNRVNLSNRYWFSYPGYNELLTGKPDQRIRSNARKANPNQTILEFANHHHQFQNKVAAFASWDVFHDIINHKRSGIHINAGNDTARLKLTAHEKFLNHLQKNTPSPWKATRFDRFTHHYAKEYLKKNYPRLLLIAYGETDEFAHQGKYDAYLQAAKNTDDFIRDIWETLQADPHYKDKTTLLITTDHGRGSGNRSWRNHGIGHAGSNHTWFAVIGPDTEPLGEVNIKAHYYTRQLAQIVAKLLELNYPGAGVVEPIIATAVGR